MRKIAFIVAFLFLVGAGWAQAQPGGVKNFAVLPFNYKGPDKHKHLGAGVQSLLETRLSWKDHFMPLPDADVSAVKNTDFNPGMQATMVLDKLKADYLFWGTVEADGDRAKVYINAQDATGHSWTKSVNTTMSELPLKLTETARAMTVEIFKRPGGEEEKAAEEKARKEAGPLAPQNPDFLYADTGKPTGEPGLNPTFRYETAPDTPDRWRSQSMRFASSGMIIEDLDGDGKNEVLIGGDEIIAVYEYRDSRLYPLAEMSLSPRFEVVRLSAIDLDRDNVKEIVVSCWKSGGLASGLARGDPEAMILNYSGGKLKVLMDGIDMFLNVVKLPPEFRPVLIGQKKARADLFNSKMIYEVVKNGDSLMTTNRVAFPEFGNVFNVSYIPTADDTGYKILLVSTYGRIRVYTPNMEQQHETQESYNGSSIGLPIVRRAVGMGPANFQDEQGMETYEYIPMPLVVTNFGSNKRFEVLVNKDISVSSQFFERYRAFSQGEIQSLFWDGVGLNLFWKTRRIKGTVVQYDVADIDNDGTLDLCICLNTYPGALGFKHRKTILVTYNLNIQDHKNRF